MSNTHAESVSAAQPQAPATTVTETSRQPKKFDNVHKTVASKAKAFFHVFHSAGENIRGNINAALDGAGDAIAGRKSGDVTARKSGDQSTRSPARPTEAESAPAPAVSESAPATTEALAPVETPTIQQAESVTEVGAQAPALAEASPETPAVLEANVATDSSTDGTAEKRFAVGQFVNQRLKRTVDLVTRVGSLMRSKSTRTAETLGNSLVEGKQRASRRFSRAPKAAPAAEEEDTTAASLPGPAETPLPDAPADTPAPIIA